MVRENKSVIEGCEMTKLSFFTFFDDEALTKFPFLMNKNVGDIKET